MRKNKRNLIAIVISFFGVILCLVLLFSIFDKNNSRQMALKYLSSVTEGVKKTVDLWVSEKKDILSFISELPDVKDALQDKTKLSGVRDRLSKTYPLDVETVFFVGVEGELLLKGSGNEVEFSNLNQLELWGKFRENGHQPYVSSSVHGKGNSEDLTFILLKGVYDGKDKLLGFVGFSTNWNNFIKKFIAPVRVGKTGYLAVTDSKGRNIGHHDSSLTLKSMNKYQWMQKIIHEQNGEQAYKFKGVNKLMAFRQSQQTGWIINASIDENELIERTDRLRNIILIISLALLIIAFFIIVWLDLIKLQVAKKNLAEEERNLRLLFRYGNEGDYSECSVFSSCLMNAFERGNDSVFIHKIASDESPGKFIKVNEAFLAFFDCSLEEVIETNPTEILKKSIKEDYRIIFQEFIKTEKQVFTTELEMKEERGFVELRLFRIKTKKGMGILGFVRDITDRVITKHKLKEDRDYLDEEVKKRTSEISAVNERLRENLKEKEAIAKALSESEASYRSFIERANDGIMLIADGRILFVNKKICSLLKAEASELKGRAFEEFVIEEDRGRVIAEHKDRVAGCDFSSIFETVLLASDGEKVDVEINAGVIYEQQNPQDFLFVRDIRLRKRLEEEKRDQQEQMIQMDKLAALGTLLAGVAHEINNPNNAVMLNSPIIREAWENISPILEKFEQENGDFVVSGMPYSYSKDYIENLIDDIYKSSEKIKNIVEELKNFARPDTSTFYEDVKMNEVVDSAVNLIKSQIKVATNHFSLELDDAVPSIEGSFTRLEQVVVNLLHNACHSLLSAESAIKVKTLYLPREEMVQVQIIDEGCGVSEENLKKMFDPFFTTKRDKGGTGLGLSVSLKIIKEHQGTLTFSSEEGKGTTATIRLPIKNGRE